MELWIMDKNRVTETALKGRNLQLQRKWRIDKRSEANNTSCWMKCRRRTNRDEGTKKSNKFVTSQASVSRRIYD